MASSGQPDPAAIRMQRSSFLASLGRPVSPPPGTAKAPLVIDLSSDDGEMMPPRKRQRLQAEEDDIVQPRCIPSPFQLTKIQNLPDSENIDTITLNDILGNPLIREAWIFNYCFDIDFTMQHFDPDVRDTVNVKVIHGSWKNEDRNKQHIDDACRRWPNVQAIQAYLPDAFGTHHTKMIVSFRHDEIAEIIIHTANMQAGDWTHATQAVWRSPSLRQGGSSVDGTLPTGLRSGSGERFKWDFLRYLRVYGKKLGGLVKEISKYDFSPIRGALIGSVPSKVKNVYADDAKMHCWGHPAVFHALKQIRERRLKLNGLHADLVTKLPHIVCQCSSVATLKAGWLQETLLAAFKAMQPQKKHTLSIIYPTAPDIAASLSGYANGPSIHMKIETATHQKQVTALRPHLCRWTRGAGQHAFRDLAAPHIKTYISFESEPALANLTPAIDWALLTSANLSVQAWGSEARMLTEKDKKKPKFNAAEAEVHIQSYELGVLVWPELWTDEDKPGGRCAMIPTFGKDLPNTSGLAQNALTVVGLRMPYDLPLTQYAAGDMPWSSHVPHAAPDRHGRTWPPDESWYE